MNDTSDLIFGKSNVARYANMTPRQVRHLAETANFPTFIVGGNTASTRTLIDAWVEEHAKAALSDAPCEVECADA